MAVVSVARFKANPARVKELFANTKKAKEVFLANGAERVFWGSVLSGTGPGEWVLMMHYADLATMERAFAAAMKDADQGGQGSHPLDPALLPPLPGQ